MAEQRAAVWTLFQSALLRIAARRFRISRSVASSRGDARLDCGDVGPDFYCRVVSYPQSPFRHSPIVLRARSIRETVVTRRLHPEPRQRAFAASVQALPSKCAGRASPNSFRIVGATSTIAGFSSMNLWLENRTPGTSRGSMQWSPLQALMLSSKICEVTLPSTESHEAR